MENKERKILIADDEPDILEFIEYNLQAEGYQVATAGNGDEALEMAKKFNPQLIILDVMMPRKSGIDVCEILRSRAEFKDTLIIFLTALNDESFQVKGLETGADDYISKPISPKVLVSRVNALFRRAEKQNTPGAAVTGFEVDPEQFLVTVKGEKKQLAKKEFELIHLLYSKPGRVFLRNEILEKIWGNEVIVGDRTIDVHIRKIRAKLGVDCIRTIKGVGYKFELQE
ncbi:MAG: response regulator transcription factor, partial [Dinghuibacter sp.]|nr:response regulator transcription factor [Dinghuibacter sp.]